MEDKTCTWKLIDVGMYGCSDYVYQTSCGKEYDLNETTKENYCQNCGGKINN